MAQHERQYQHAMPGDTPALAEAREELENAKLARDRDPDAPGARDRVKRARRHFRNVKGKTKGTR